MGRTIMPIIKGVKEMTYGIIIGYIVGVLIFFDVLKGNYLLILLHFSVGFILVTLIYILLNPGLKKSKRKKRRKQK